MSWHRLLLELKSPLHVGYSVLGFVQRTRYYLPARSIWGTLVAAKARTEANGKFPEYKKFETEISNQFRFTHFFVCTGKDHVYEYFLPNFNAGGKHGVPYGNLSKTQFEQRFISSFGQTALDPACLTADDESLHEKEIISHLTIPQKKEDNPQPVMLCGYVYCGNDVDAETLKLLDGCQVGADRRNGLGKIGKAEPTLIKNGDNHGIKFNKNTTLRLESKVPFPCHIPVNCGIDNGINISGDIEYLQWRSWDDNKGAGQKKDQYGNIPCWVPGSFSESEITIIPDEKNVGIFQIQKDK
jgi:hypothetical protein